MMKFSSVLRGSFHIYRKHFRELMTTLLLEIVLRLIALAPLLFLAAPQTKPLALLSIPLYLLIVLPARQNVALCVQDLLAGGSLFTLKLVSTEDYGKKLLRGLTATLKMLLWSSLAIFSVALALWAQQGGQGRSIDGLTLMRFVQNLGGGDLVTGFVVVAAIFLVTLIPPVIGLAFHSGDRHAAALNAPKLAKGYRGALIGLWFGGLLVFLPFVIAVIFPCASFVQALKGAVSAFMETLTFTFPAMGATLAVLGGLILVLLLPVIPLRTLMPAVYVRAAQEHAADHAS